jgi:hypothetical protein
MTLTTVLLIVLQAPEAKPWSGYDRGVRWETSLDEARKRAAKEGKPVLFHQLVGRMDKEGC